MRLGESKQYHQRYLTGARTPWYKAERRVPSPLLMGVFFRGEYKVIRNTSKAIALTCFHGFQPNLFGAACIDRLFLFLFSAKGRQIVSRSRRQYGGGLDKYEPGDINSASVPGPGVFAEISDADVQKAMRSIQVRGRLPRRVDRVFARLT